MSLRLHSFLRRIQRLHSRKFSTAVNIKDEQTSQVSTFRTLESNPVNHNENHIGRMYTIHKDLWPQLFQTGGMTGTFRKQCNTFQECSIMVRQPAVEIISYLQQADYTRPANKYILYGKYGTGKSITLSHLLHYAFIQRYVLVHVYWAPHWFRNMKEVANSALSPGCMDLPIDAGMWLKHFKTQNSALLSLVDHKISKEYVWNQRESTPQGTTFLELIDFGLNRMKYACGVVDALLKELKLASIAGKCKMMVIIDGYNAFTSNSTHVYNDNKTMMLPNEITLAIPFIDLVKGDWCNGAVIMTVDRTIDLERQESDLPRYLLGKEGFEYLDPFVPVLVSDYNVSEFESMIDYYKDRKWIRNITPKGQRELEVITNRNPFELMIKCTLL